MSKKPKRKLTAAEKDQWDQRDPKAYQTPEPMTQLSYNSRLSDFASRRCGTGVAAIAIDGRD
ncbi:MAG TPA: hypothetical protein PLR25_08095 [Planctomycetaceae bacterium]|nr:hypothetical protein [Planctomycetaceae bacterium]